MAKGSYARPQKNTKSELYVMLAEAVRNTQPQPQPEPVRDARPTPKLKTRTAPKRPAKNKSVRASASRKSRPSTRNQC
jgi:hypothetical protein